MERRNFFSVCIGTGLALLGYKAAESCTCEIEELEDFIPPTKYAEITFYGLFTDEANKQAARTGDLVYVDNNGYCTFNNHYRHIGYIKNFDDNGVLVSLTNQASYKYKALHNLPAKGWDTRGYVPSFEV